MTNFSETVKKSNFPIHFCVFPLSILFILLLVISLIDLNSNLPVSGGVIDYITTNLKTDPISELTLTDDECPEGMEEHVLGHWAGTYEGCHIGDKINNFPCASNIAGRIGEVIPEKSPVDLKFWGMRKFCIKRLADYQYVGPKTPCPKEYKECHETLCIPKDEKCPITGLQTSENQDPDNDKITSVQLSAGKYLWIERDDKKIPLYNVEISLNGKPCFSMGFNPYIQSPYPLLKAEFRCGSYGRDESALILDTKEEEVLYKDNNINLMLADLPHYYDYIRNNVAHLVSRKRIELKNNEVCVDAAYNLKPILISPLITEVKDWSAGIILILLWEAFLFLFSLIAIINAVFFKGDAEFWHLLNNTVAGGLTLASLVTVLLVGGGLLSVSDLLKGNYEPFHTLVSKYCFVNHKYHEATEDFTNYSKVIPGGISFTIEIMLFLSIARAIYVSAVLYHRRKAYE